LLQYFTGMMCCLEPLYPRRLLLISNKRRLWLFDEL